MNVLYPYVLIGVPVVGVLFIWLGFYMRKHQKQDIQKIILLKMLDNWRELKAVKTIQLILGCLVIVLLLMGLSRPQWGEVWEEIPTQNAEILFAVDVSKSMLAQDLKPNRLERAKLSIMDIFEKMRGVKVGLIAFAGESFLQCPLTLDYDAFRIALEEINIGVIYQGGTNISNVFYLADKVFNKKSKIKIVVLLTDGENLAGNLDGVVKLIKEDNISVCAIGIGSKNGELIPIEREDGQIDFLRDKEGKLVKTKLDESSLEIITQAGNGLYFNLQKKPSDVIKITEWINSKLPIEKEGVQVKLVKNDRYDIFLIMSLILLLSSFFIDFKKNKRSAQMVSLFLFAFSLMQFNPSAFCNDIKGLDEVNYDKYFKENINKVREDTKDTELLYNLGTAAFYNEDYKSSQSFLEKALDDADVNLQSKIYYNLGNTLYRLGQTFQSSEPKKTVEYWEDSLKNYKNSLDINHENQDPEINYNFVKKKLDELKKELEKKDDQNSSNKDEKDDQKEDSDSKNDKNDDGENSSDSEDSSGDNEDNSEKNKNNQDQQKEESSDNKNSEGQSQEKDNLDKNNTGGNKSELGDEEKRSEKDIAEARKAVDFVDVKDEGKKGDRMSKQEALEALNALKEDESKMPLYLSPYQKDSDILKDW